MVGAAVLRIPRANLLFKPPQVHGGSLVYEDHTKNYVDSSIPFPGVCGEDVCDMGLFLGNLQLVLFNFGLPIPFTLSDKEHF